jgi:acetyl esterase/lipase
MTVNWLILIPGVIGLEGRMEEAFGKIGDPPDAMRWQFSVFDWMFRSMQPWGPYGSPWGDNKPQTFTYRVLGESPRNYTCEPDNAGIRAWSGKLEMDIYTPPKEKMRGELAPLIFFIHGGGWFSGDKESFTDGIAYWLDRGYAVASSQYAYICWGYHVDEILDQLTEAFEYVHKNATHFRIDTSRIFMKGGSAGAHLSMMLSYTMKSEWCGDWKTCGIKSVFDMYGPKEVLNAPLGLPQSFLDQVHTELTGTPDKKEWPQYFPMAHVSESTPPTFIYHGTWDILVPYQQAVDLNEKLEKFGVKHYLLPLYTFNHVPEAGYYGIPGQIERYIFERWLTIDFDS